MPEKEKAAPSSTRVIVEGEPVSGPPLDQPDLGTKPDESSPQPKVSEIVALAKDKLEAASGDGFSVEQTKIVLDATDVEPLWVPDNEKLSVYANPIAKQTHERKRDKNDGAGIGVGN